MYLSKGGAYTSDGINDTLSFRETKVIYNIKYNIKYNLNIFVFL